MANKYKILNTGTKYMLPCLVVLHNNILKIHRNQIALVRSMRTNVKGTSIAPCCLRIYGEHKCCFTLSSQLFLQWKEENRLPFHLLPLSLAHTHTRTFSHTHSHSHNLLQRRRLFGNNVTTKFARAVIM